MPTSFTISFAADERGGQSRLHPADHLIATKTVMPSRVLQLLDDHRPWDIMDNMALIIVNQTYAALLEILGPAAPSATSDNGHVEVSRPVDPTDPDSPLLSVNASATHCCICLVNSLHGGATTEYKRYTSRKQKGRPPYHLAHASVSVSSGTLHVALAGGVPATDCWTSADVRPNVSERGLFGVLDTIMSRLDAAIRIEARLIEMAKASGCKSCPKVNEIIEVRMALEKMRGELDFYAIVRRRRQKRRRGIQEISCGPDVNMVDDADVLVNRLRELRICKKRCPPAAEMDQVDDADVLTKRLRALQV